MNNLLKCILNYGLFFSLIFLINSCAHFKISKLEQNNYNIEDFYIYLSKEYLNYAKFELYEMHDEIDANLFAHKASLSINKKIFYPEDPKKWKIPEKYKIQVNNLHKQINGLIQDKVYKKFPKQLSIVISAYDCWVEQIEENWQISHIEECYYKLDKSLKYIKTNLSNINSDIEYNNNKNTQKNLVENFPEKKSKYSYLQNKNVQIFETKVFFEFDKFTLSAGQVIELELLINTAFKNSNMNILIEGHTDTMGDNYYNNILSKKRAVFIKEYLLSRKVTNIIQTKAYGESKLLVPTADEVKEKTNRRAEIFLK